MFVRPLGRALAGVAGAALFASALIGCSSSSGSTSSNSGSTSSNSGSASGGGGYQLGFQAGLSGTLADLGQAYANGFKNAIGWQNSHGGIGGKKISVDYVDDRQDGTAAAAAYRQFAQQGALGVFGLQASTETAAVQPLSDALGVPVVGSTIAPFGKNVFNAGPDLNHEITAEIPLVNALAQKSGKKNARVALVYITTPAGVAASSFAQKYLKEAGYTVVSDIGTPPDLTSFGTQAAQISAAKPDYVLAALAGAGLDVVVPALRSSGVTQPIINFWAGASASTLRQLHDSSLYVYRTFADPSEDAAATMRAHAKAQGLPDGTSYASGNYYTQGYVMGLVAIGVLKACGSSCTASKFSSLLASSASQVNTGGLAAPGSGYSSTDRFFVHGVHYWTWDAGNQVPAPLASAPDYPPSAG